MARSKSSKFFLYAAKKSGYYKGKRLLGINHAYEGGVDSLTVKDLVDFLKDEKIELSNVALPGGFITTAKEC